MAIHPLWLVLIALLPAGATWWTGRRVLRRIDDPALPDILMRRRGQMGALWGMALVGIVALDGAHAGWAIPLMAVSTMAASFPAQRVLLDERWGMGAYLVHSTRRLAGGLAFWVALVLAPIIVMRTRDPGTAALVAVLLAAGLGLWIFNSRRIWLWAHAATPLGARPALDERFAAVMARATTTPPLLYRFGQPGERRAAAYALPSAGRTGAVIFSDALLELLTPEETAAVFAHEVAHLEHYTPRRMQRMRMVAALLVVALLGVSLVAQRWAPDLHLAYALVGGFAVLLALGVRASRTRGHETASDLRGAELCGDAEALVRALTKLHTALRLPHRWSADVERTATHPSLVHRIAALRGETTPATPVAGTPAVPAPRRRAAAVLAVCAATLALMLAGQLGVLFLLAAGALALPGAMTLGAFGAAAVARTAIVLVNGGAGDASSGALLLLALLCGGVALALAVRGASTGAAERARSPRSILVALGALTMLYAAAVVWAATLTTPATALPLLRTVAALAVGLAAAVALHPEHGRRRWLGVPVAVALAALVPSLAASLFRSGATSPSIVWRDVPARVASSASLADMARDLAVAPGGARYVVRLFPAYTGSDAEDEYTTDSVAPPRLLLGALGARAASLGPPRTMEGHAAAFVGDDSLLLLASHGGDAAGSPALELRLSAIADDEGAPVPRAPAWRLALPMLLAPELRLDVDAAGARRWSVTGVATAEAHGVTTLAGRIGDTAIVRHDWTATSGIVAGESSGGYAAVTPLGDGSAIAARLRGEYRATFALGMLGVSPWTTELSIVGAANGPRRLAELPGVARCVAGHARPVAICTLMQPGGATRLVAVDSAFAVETLASLAEPVTAFALAADGRIALAVAGSHALMILDPAHHTGLRLALPADLLTAIDVEWTTRGEVVAVGYGRGGTKVVRMGGDGLR